MSRDLLLNIVAAGLDTGTAQKALDAGWNLTKLRAATKKELEAVFYTGEVERIRAALQRKEIDEKVVRELIEKCDWSCCMCWNLDKRDPIILHHIVEHAKTADDSYANLAVLCLNHHGTAHSSWQISRHPLPPDLIRMRKAEFETALAEFKIGKRAAPGREGDGSDPTSHSDVEALRQIAGFLSRPAVYRRFQTEGNMQDFLTAMDDVMRTLNTGVMKTREGYDVGRTKSVRQFSNPHWRERMELLARELDAISERVQMAIRLKELMVNADTGFYCFENPFLADEIDTARHSAVRLLNGVLTEAGIDRIRGPGDR